MCDSSQRGAPTVCDITLSIWEKIGLLYPEPGVPKIAPPNSECDDSCLLVLAGRHCHSHTALMK